MLTIVELEAGRARGALSWNCPVRLRIDASIVRTTVGRALLWRTIERWVPIAEVNRTVTAAVRAHLLELVADRRGALAAQYLAEALDQFGGAVASELGFSTCAEDLRLPEAAGRLRDRIRADEKRALGMYEHGELTEGELRNETWRATETAEIEMENELLRTPPDEAIGALLASGLASPADVRRATAFVGIVASRHREDAVVSAAMREGLHATEWMATARRSRARAVDRRLQAERAALLLEELLAALGDVRVTELDCGSREGRLIRTSEDDLRVVATAGERAVGRTLAETLHSREGAALVERGRIIDAEARDVVDCELVSVRARSLLGCRTKDGVCSACYGWDPRTRRPVPLRSRVGIHAARAIARLAGDLRPPRTMQICGGMYSRLSTRGPRTEHAGRVRWVAIDAAPLVVDGAAGEVHVALGDGLVAIVDDEGGVLERFRVRAGDVMHAADGERVERGSMVVAEYRYGPAVVASIPADASAIVHHERVGEITDEVTGLSRTDVGALALTITHSDGTGSTLRMELPRRGWVQVDDGAQVRRGALLALLRTGSDRSISGGGLPGLLSVLEASGAPRRAIAVTALHDGTVRVPDRHTVEVHGSSGRAQRHRVRDTRYGPVVDGQSVSAGDALTWGSRSHADLLRAWGAERLALHVLDELVSIFHASRVPIAEVHLELVARAMLRWARVGRRRVPLHLAPDGAKPTLLGVAAMARRARS